MHEFLHILGLCSDSFSHLDLIDVIIANYNQIQTLINNITSRWG